MKKKKGREHLLRLTKETPQARKRRVSTGVRLRAAVFQDKRRRALGRKPKHGRADGADE